MRQPSEPSSSTLAIGASISLIATLCLGGCDAFMGPKTSDVTLRETPSGCEASVTITPVRDDKPLLVKIQFRDKWDHPVGHDDKILEHTVAGEPQTVKTIWGGHTCSHASRGYAIVRTR